jgi:hypothetical protein
MSANVPVMGHFENRAALGTVVITLRELLAVILRVPRVESRLFFRPLHASVKSRHCGFSDSIERKVPCTEEKDRDSTRGTRRMTE